MVEKEGKENIEWMCQDCSKLRRQDWQDHNTETVIKKDDFVKVGLRDKDAMEHCWLKVERVSEDGQIIWGTLDNIPVVLKNFKLGAGVIIQREEIEDHR